MKKKLLALAVCVAMLFSVAPVSFVSFAQGLTFTTYYPDARVLEIPPGVVMIPMHQFGTGYGSIGKT